ncbi:MAG TPA: DUF2975 domain-containing protein [Spirochaetota bacterium]|nr:DUF2975 domain-containing protein [Spirochaetota bacterium]
MNDNINRIKSMSRVFRIIFFSLVIAIPVGFALYWGFYNILPVNFRLTTQEFPMTADSIAGFNRMLCAAAGIIPLAVHIGIVFTLARLFGMYERGDILTAGNVSCIRKLGYLFIARAVAGIIHTPLLALALTITNTPGNRQISLSLSSDEISSVLTGFVIIVIARVMDEGRAASDEQKLVI